MTATYGGHNYGTAPYGGPLQRPLRRPLLAKLYDFNGNFIKSLGPILDVPTFKWTLNAGGHPIEITLPKQDTSATKPVPGNQVYLTEDGGDGSIRYRGIIEETPETLDVRVKYALSLQPMVVELGNAPVNKSYTTATDVAQMVRDAVTATSHLTWTNASIPLTGITAFYYFAHTTALDVLSVARQIAGVNYWWHVDRTGLVWFQPFDSSRAVYTAQRGQHYRSRVSTPNNIKDQLNHLVVVGAVPPQGSAPITSTYDGASQATIGVRAAKTPFVYKTVSDQGTLDAIKTTLGAAFDRQLTKHQLVLDNFVDPNGYPLRVELGQQNGATMRYWEPAAEPMQESGTGTGTYSSNYVVLEATEAPTETTVILADVPINGLNDLKYEVDRIIQRTALDSLIYTPAAFSTQVGTLLGGGVQTATDPAPGVPSVARWKLDGPAFRAFDGSSTDYGLPDGVGETVRVGSDGVAWLAKLLLQSAKAGARIVFDTKTDPANPLITVYDSTPVARAQMGSLQVNGISPAQFGFRANDASGNPIFDSLGLIAVMKLLASVTLAETNFVGVAGPPFGPSGVGGEVTLMTTPSFSTTRSTKVMVLATIFGTDAVLAGVGTWYFGANLYARVSGQTNSQFGTIPAIKTNAAVYPIYGSATVLQLLTLPAGSYTASAYWESKNGTNDTGASAFGGSTYVFQLGG